MRRKSNWVLNPIINLRFDATMETALNDIASHRHDCCCVKRGKH